MRTSKAPWSHLSRSDDLVTSYEAIRAGFVALALEKNRQGTPTVEEARALKATASQAKDAASLLKIPGIEAALLTAAGVSDKAAQHMQAEDKLHAIQGLIEHFLQPAGPAFVEELVYRFLLTRGDSLGGSMRNLGGVMAQRKFTRTMIATLSLAGTSYQWYDSASKTWVPLSGDDADIEARAKGLAWSKARQLRTMVYNHRVPLVGNNVDVCLLRCSPQEEASGHVCSTPALYIALGELKGGIDPAGADEHWKTARTTLLRIRSSFGRNELAPATFFVAAAIVNRMAEEIWHQLQDGMLSNAANLTNANQVAYLCRWLTSL